MYLIQATILYPADAAGYRRTVQVPTFGLPADVHGLLSPDAAERFAVQLLTAIAGPDVLVHAIATPPYCVNQLS